MKNHRVVRRPKLGPNRKSRKGQTRLARSGARRPGAMGKGSHGTRRRPY